MERLTNKQTSRCVSCGANEECTFAAGEFSAPCPDYRRYQRLADIDDILGDDYDLDRLKELVEADREGKVILCHIKEGSKVYIILLGRIFPFDVISATLYGENIVSEAEHGMCLKYRFDNTDIGTSVFLTKEEAEAAMERMKNRNEA